MLGFSATVACLPGVVSTPSPPEVIEVPTNSAARGGVEGSLGSEVRSATKSYESPGNRPEGYLESGHLRRRTDLSEVTFTPQRPAMERNGGDLSLRRRRSLPGGRAVVGGFLIALAAVGTFAAYTGATADTRDRFVVARQDLPIGHRITKADLGEAAMDLPPALRARVWQDPSRLVGAVVVGPVGNGELIQAADVVNGDEAGATGPQVSFPIDSARALAGSLKVGEVVDVLATYDAAGGGQTTAVVRGARVVDRSQPDSRLGEGGKEVVTLSVVNRSDTLAVAHAANAGEVTLVRVTGQPQQPASAGSTYQAPSSGRSPSSPGG